MHQRAIHSAAEHVATEVGWVGRVGNSAAEGRPAKEVAPEALCPVRTAAPRLHQERSVGRALPLLRTLGHTTGQRTVRSPRRTPGSPTDPKESPQRCPSPRLNDARQMSFHCRSLTRTKPGPRPDPVQLSRRPESRRSRQPSPSHSSISCRPSPHCSRCSSRRRLDSKNTCRTTNLTCRNGMHVTNATHGGGRWSWTRTMQGLTASRVKPRAWVLLSASSQAVCTSRAAKKSVSTHRSHHMCS